MVFDVGIRKHSDTSYLMSMRRVVDARERDKCGVPEWSGGQCGVKSLEFRSDDYGSLTLSEPGRGRLEGACAQRCESVLQDSEMPG